MALADAQEASAPVQKLRSIINSPRTIRLWKRSKPALTSGLRPLGGVRFRCHFLHLETTAPSLFPRLPPSGVVAMKALHRHRTLSIVTSALLLTEFLLFLLVALSLPIIKEIYILGVNAHVQPGQPATSVASRLRFGVWGVCARG